MLEWVQEDPEASAMAPLDRLRENHPDRFSRANVRALQRRVQKWRGIMANQMAHAAYEAPLPDPARLPERALAGTDPRC